MSPRAIALGIIFFIVAIGSTLGFYAGTRRKMSLEQWTVGGRGFGPLLMWLLMAGEVYTTFSFLGASGWVYSQGGPTLYILPNITLAYVVSFFLLPPIWELGRKHGLHTQSDFFEKVYGSKHLAAFVAIVGVVFIVPYLQLQFTGLGIIVEISSFDAIGRTPAMLIAGALIAGFVFASGVRAVAWVSVLKDGLMVLAALVIGFGVPYAHFGGIGPMFAALAKAHPEHLTMPGATTNHTHAWFISTVLLTSLGCYMWPHVFGAAFTARSGEVLRRNAVVMPLYQLTLGLMFIAGFSAILIVPGLSNGDLALLTAVRQTFPPWLLGVIGGAGALTAMVPAAILVLSASTLFAKNVWRPMFAPAMSDERVARLARMTVLALSSVSLFLAIYSSSSLVSLLLLGYAGVTQFLPGVVLALWWPKVRMPGVFAGLAAGVACVAILGFSGRDPFYGMNAGFVGLCMNFAVTGAISVCISDRATLAAPQAELYPAQKSAD